MSAKQAVNDKLQGSVATCFRCGGVVNNQIKKGKQERDCLMHWCAGPTLLKDGKSARNNHVLVCNFAKYSPIKKIFHSQIHQ